MSGRALSRLHVIHNVLTAAATTAPGAASAGVLCSTPAATGLLPAAAAATWAIPQQAAAATAPSRRYCRPASPAAPQTTAKGSRPRLGYGLLGLTRPATCTSTTAIASPATPSPHASFLCAIRPLSNGPTPPVPAAAGAAAETVKQEARAVGGETAASSRDSGNLAAQPLLQPSQQQQQHEQQQQARDGWDGEEEPPPVPLDPNAETPGVLFVTAGAAISALIAVVIAALGILGTFYAGWVINSINKELQAASGGGGAGAGAGARGAPAATPARSPPPAVSPPEAGTAAAAAAPPANGTRVSMATNSAEEPGEPRAGTPVPTVIAGAVPPQPKRSWWSWLGLGWRRQPRREGTEPDKALPA